MQWSKRYRLFRQSQRAFTEIREKNKENSSREKLWPIHRSSVTTVCVCVCRQWLKRKGEVLKSQPFACRVYRFTCLSAAHFASDGHRRIVIVLSHEIHLPQWDTLIYASVELRCVWGSGRPPENMLWIHFRATINLGVGKMWLIQYRCYLDPDQQWMQNGIH